MLKVSPFYFFSYVISKVEIWKANPRKKDELWLFPGVHEYPFTYALPIDLPESMDESGYASINYTIKVCYVNKKRVLIICLSSLKIKFEVHYLYIYEPYIYPIGYRSHAKRPNIHLNGRSVQHYSSPR